MCVSGKSKLTKNAYEEGHRVHWDEVRIWEIESDSKYREHKDIRPYGVFKKFDHTTQLEISHICISLISQEVTNS
jgi:hypothetical protein